MNTTSPVSTNNKLNRTRPLGRLMTILITGLGVVAVLFVLGWVGRKGLVKIISDLADRPFASGDFASAAQRYSWSLQLDTQHLHSRVNRALAYRGLNQKELAAADFLTCAKTQPRSDAEYSLRAECYLQLSQPREALADLNHELAAHPDDADGFAMRARALALLKQWHPAIADVTQALAVQPGRADFALQRSELRERVGDVTGALEDALLSAKLQPTPAAFVQQAKLLRAQKNLSAAEAAYTQALQQQPNNAAALLERAQLRLALGLLDGALSDVEAAWKLAPGDAPLRLRARVYRSMGKPELALRDLDDLLTHNPDDTKLLATRANLNRLLGNIEAMQTDWLRVVVLEPSTASAYVELGVSEWKQDRSQQALAHLARAIQLGTQDADAFAVRGRIVLAQGQPTEALQDLMQALALEPNDVATLIVRGKAYGALNQFENAQADFDKAATLEPDNVQAFVARGRFFAQQNKPALGLPDLQAAAKLAADAPALQLQLLNEQVHVLEALGHRSEAQAVLERVSVLLPEDTTTLKHLAKLLQQQGKLDEARITLESLQKIQANQAAQVTQAKTAINDVAMQLRIAALYEKQGKFDEAVAAYGIVLSQTNQTDDLVATYVRLGKLQYGLQHNAQSLLAFQAALKLDQTQPEVFLGIGLNRRKLGYTCGAARSFQVYLKLAPDAPQRDELSAWLRKHQDC